MPLCGGCKGTGFLTTQQGGLTISETKIRSDEAISAGIRCQALQDALDAVSAEDMFDEIGDATDAAYSRAIQDCKDVIQALIQRMSR